MAAASAGLASKECGSAEALLMIDVTVARSPATAFATLPQTSVEATTVGTPAPPAPLVPLSLLQAPSPAVRTTTERPAASRIMFMDLVSSCSVEA